MVERKSDAAGFDDDVPALRTPNGVGHCCVPATAAADMIRAARVEDAQKKVTFNDPEENPLEAMRRGVGGGRTRLHGGTHDV